MTFTLEELSVTQLRLGLRHMRRHTWTIGEIIDEDYQDALLFFKETSDVHFGEWP